MSGPAVCSISAPVRDELRALRFRKTGPNSANADSKAVVLKIDRAAQAVVVDEVIEDITADELRDQGGRRPTSLTLSILIIGNDW